MKREDLLSPLPPAAQVELALAGIESSRAFRGSPRHRALLRHLVQRTLGDELSALKESVIAIEVFGRQASAFDPKLDSIVRVESRRLRARLATYFEGEGRDSTLRIELPIGSYVPVIAQRLRPQYAPDATRRARDLVERGEHFLRQPLSEATLTDALRRFEAALLESPDHVPALVGAGRAWLNLATARYLEPPIAAEHAAESLRRAIRLDDGNAIAHALLGAIEHTFVHDWVAARRSFRRAVERAPQTAFVHSAYGCHLMNRGELDAADVELSLARRLDPQYVNTRIHMVNLRIAQGRLDAAEAELEGMRDIAPDSMPLIAMAGLLSLVRGDAETALTHYRRTCALAPGHPGCVASVAAVLGYAGRIDEADATMARLLEEHGPNAVSPYVSAIVATRCGRTDRAFELLQHAVDGADPGAIVLPIDASFASLRSDPRWLLLVAALRKPRRT
ncbi:MAG: tetratricopeptide repeat protein [Caldimonas sp.]